MNIALVDLPDQRQRLFPLTMTRPSGDLRVGILTIREKWEKNLDSTISFITDSRLSVKYPSQHKTFDLLINGSVCPNRQLVEAIQSLDDHQGLFAGDVLLAIKSQYEIADPIDFLKIEHVQFHDEFTIINHPYDLFVHNAKEIKTDFELLTAGRTSASIADPHTIIYGIENVFLEAGVKIKAAILNAEEGPIYLGKNAEIQEGATIRGPFALGENARINMGAKIREAVTIGPNCKIGGELSNSIIYGNSNKAHDGFLGNAVIGEWCNLGAGTNNSNLKNNYAIVKIWDYTAEQFVSTELQFCGLMMGDHSKTAINTMLNTGTVIGVCCNIFGSGFPRTYIPSFSWGGVSKSITHSFEKAITTARIVMQRKGKELTKADQNILKTIFDQSAKNRR